jgi:hypothetical protein
MARYSLASGIYQVKFTTVVHYIKYDRILPELVDKRSDLRVEYEALCSAAAIDNSC